MRRSTSRQDTGRDETTPPHTLISRLCLDGNESFMAVYNWLLNYNPRRSSLTLCGVVIPNILIRILSPLKQLQRPLDAHKFLQNLFSSWRKPD